MKVNLINTGHYRKRGMESSSAGVKSCVHDRSNLKQNNYEKINTTIKSNSDGRVSFKGAPILHYVGQFASWSPLIAEAIFAIFITCGARPATILATAKTEEDKEKCSYQAAKSISSGLIGLGMTTLVGTPIAKAVKQSQKHKAFEIPADVKETCTNAVKNSVKGLADFSEKLLASGKEKDIKLAGFIKEFTLGDKLNLSMISNGSNKAIKGVKHLLSEKCPEIEETVVNGIKNQKILNNYEKTAKNVMDKLFQPIFMPARAEITVAMVPILLGLMGKRMLPAKPQDTNLLKQLNYDVLPTQKDEKVFSSFSGVARNENK